MAKKNAKNAYTTRKQRRALQQELAEFREAKRLLKELDPVYVGVDLGYPSKSVSATFIKHRNFHQTPQLSSHIGDHT
jgi:hypothetical protein